MRLFHLPLLIAFSAIFSSATAAEDLCSTIPDIQQHSEIGCDCGAALSGLSGLPAKAPKGMSLIAVCGFKKVEFVGTVGEFFFKGTSTVKGQVMRVKDPILGDIVRFKAKSAGKQSALQTLKFGSDSPANLKFRTPALTDESPCWAAEAIINVSLLNVHVGYESDADGSYPKDFEVLKVGQYSPCQIEEAGDDED